MLSIRLRSPRAGIGILIIVIIFMLTLLHLGHPPETVLLIVAGAGAVAVKAARHLAPPAQAREA
jgi:hypothetical protein